MAIIVLESLFEEFCDFVGRRLYWSRAKSSDADWTEAVLGKQEHHGFFQEFNEKQAAQYHEDWEYLRLDYVWRYKRDVHSKQGIVLAVEHENTVYQVDALLASEISHLADVKAEHKVGIFYINEGTEEKFVEATGKAISERELKFPFEHYLIILGYSSNHGHGIEFKGYFFDGDGRITGKKRCLVRQAS